MLAIGCDHGGYNLKMVLIEHLKERNIEYKDFGTYSKESVDYPNYAQKVAEAVINKECTQGVLCCGTGIGMSIAANKIVGIRAAHVTDVFSARMTKMHNNANIICMGERIIGVGLAKLIFDEWYDVKFEGGRHERRLSKVSDLERKNYKDCLK